MKKYAAGAGLVVALAGIVGGVAYGSTLGAQPVKAPAPMVAVPAAQEQPTTSTSSAAPTTVATTTAPKPAVTTAAPAPVKMAPVASTRTAAPAPVKQTTVKRYTVSSQPAPADTTGTTGTPTTSTGTPAPQVTPVPGPPLPTGLTPNTWTGQAGGDTKVSAGS